MQYLNKIQIREILSQRKLTQGIMSLKDLPLPSSLKGVQEAAVLIATTMQKGKRILVVGDYDADGVNASALMRYFFDMLGYKHCDVIIPNRFCDGYGITPTLLKRLNAPQTYELVVTADNGISAFEAGVFCKEHNLMLIISDHHTPKDSLPLCDVLINPKQEGCTFPFKDICGCVVAWYLCAGIKQIMNADIDMSVFLPFLALATLGDVMPLVGLNRILVKKGLESIKKSNMPMCQVLRHKIGILNAQNISFGIIPLLNCAGRIGDANVALDFLLAPSVQVAEQHYKTLESINKERKVVQNEILLKAREVEIHTRSCVYAIGKNWHIGVLGIICSQLSEIHKKNAFVLSDEGNGVLKGSGRAFLDYNLIQSLQNLQNLKPLLLEFGGHQGAAGLQIHKCNIKDFMELFEQCLVVEKSENMNDVLGYVSACDIDSELLEILEEFEPFGQDNPQPYFICNDLKLIDSKPMGKTKEHLRFNFQDNNGKNLYGVAFFSTHSIREEWVFCLTQDIFLNRLCLRIRSE